MKSSATSLSCLQGAHTRLLPAMPGEPEVCSATVFDGFKTAGPIRLVDKLVMDTRVSFGDPRAIFSDGVHLYLSSCMRFLTKFSIDNGLEEQAHIDLGSAGIESFTGYDQASRSVWAVSTSGKTLRIYNRDLQLKQTVAIPRNEGIYFTFDKQEYFIDSYNSPFSLHRLHKGNLYPLPIPLPSAPFARDFLAPAYGYPFPAFYFKASRILFGFDGHAFRLLGRIHDVDGAVYDCTQVAGHRPISLCISNDSFHDSQTYVVAFAEGDTSVQTAQVEGMTNSGSFCLAGENLVILSHHNAEVRIVSLDRLLACADKPAS